MKLKDAARFFDRTTAKNAYDVSETFKCQLEPFDYFKIDGAAVKRRVMSTAPGVAIPTRRVITIDGQPYLVGDSSSDHWEDQAIRKRYVLQGADQVVTIRTIAEVLADDLGVQAYASIDFSKYGTDERDSSDYHPQYHIYVAAGESVAEFCFIETLTDVFLVRNAHRAVSGLLDAIVNRLDSPIIDAATFSSRTYDPITDTYSATPTPVRCIRVRWQEHFEYLSVSSLKFERGDMQILAPLSVTPKAGDTFSLSDGDWKIMGVVVRSDYQMLHVRRS